MHRNKNEFTQEESETGNKKKTILIEALVLFWLKYNDNLHCNTRCLVMRVSYKTIKKRYGMH